MHLQQYAWSPLPLLFPYLTSPLFLLSFPYLSPIPSPSLLSFFPSPLIRSRPLKSNGVGSTVSSPVGSRAEPQPKSNLVHFSFKIWHLVATISMIFLRINLQKATASLFPLVLISFGGMAFPKKVFWGTAFPVFPLDYAIVSLYSMERFQWNLPQIFVMWFGIAEKVFRVKDQVCSMIKA